MSDHSTNLSNRATGTGSMARPNVGGRFGQGQRLLNDGISDPIADIEKAAASVEPEFLLVEGGRTGASDRLLGHLLHNDATSMAQSTHHTHESLWMTLLDQDWMETHAFVENHQQNQRETRSRGAEGSAAAESAGDDDGADPDRDESDPAPRAAQAEQWNAPDADRTPPHTPVSDIHPAPNVADLDEPGRPTTTMATPTESSGQESVLSESHVHVPVAAPEPNLAENKPTTDTGSKTPSLESTPNHDSVDGGPQGPAQPFENATLAASSAHDLSAEAQSPILAKKADLQDRDSAMPSGSEVAADLATAPNAMATVLPPANPPRPTNPITSTGPKENANWETHETVESAEKPESLAPQTQTAAASINSASQSTNVQGPRQPPTRPAKTKSSSSDILDLGTRGTNDPTPVESSSSTANAARIDPTSLRVSTAATASGTQNKSTSAENTAPIQTKTETTESKPDAATGASTPTTPQSTAAQQAETKPAGTSPDRPTGRQSAPRPTALQNKPNPSAPTQSDPTGRSVVRSETSEIETKQAQPISTDSPHTTDSAWGEVKPQIAAAQPTRDAASFSAQKQSTLHSSTPATHPVETGSPQRLQPLQSIPSEVETQVGATKVNQTASSAGMADTANPQVDTATLETPFESTAAVPAPPRNSIPSTQTDILPESTTPSLMEDGAAHPEVASTHETVSPRPAATKMRSESKETDSQSLLMQAHHPAQEQSTETSASITPDAPMKAVDGAERARPLGTEPPAASVATGPEASDTPEQAVSGFQSHAGLQPSPPEPTMGRVAPSPAQPSSPSTPMGSEADIQIDAAPPSDFQTAVGQPRSPQTDAATTLQAPESTMQIGPQAAVSTPLEPLAPPVMPTATQQANTHPISPAEPNHTVPPTTTADGPPVSPVLPRPAGGENGPDSMPQLTERNMVVEQHVTPEQGPTAPIASPAPQPMDKRATASPPAPAGVVQGSTPPPSSTSAPVQMRMESPSSLPSGPAQVSASPSSTGLAMQSRTGNQPTSDGSLSPPTPSSTIPATSDDPADGPRAVPNDPAAPGTKVVPTSPPVEAGGLHTQAGQNLFFEEHVQREAPTTTQDWVANPMRTDPVNASGSEPITPVANGESKPTTPQIPSRTVPMPHESTASGPNMDAREWAPTRTPRESTATPSERNSTFETSDELPPRGKPVAEDSDSWTEASVLEIDGRMAPQMESRTTIYDGQTGEPQPRAMDREHPTGAIPHTEAPSTEPPTKLSETTVAPVPQARTTSVTEPLPEMKGVSSDDRKSAAMMPQSAAPAQHDPPPAVTPPKAPSSARLNPRVVEHEHTQAVRQKPGQPNQPAPTHSRTARTEEITARPKPNRTIDPAGEQSVHQSPSATSTIEETVKPAAGIDEPSLHISPHTIRPDVETATSMVAPSPLPTRSESKPMIQGPDGKPSNNESQASMSTTNPVMITIGKVVIEWEPENTGQNRPTLPKGIDIHKPWN